MRPANVLVIMADQFKATASHLYGNSFCETPSLERMAGEGVLFDNAFVPQPLCVPARASMWTSQFPHSHGARRNETLLPAGAVHAFQIWKEAGLYIALIGKNHCFGRPEDLALFDVWCEIGHRGLPKGKPPKGMRWFRPEESIEEAHRIRNDMPRQSPRFSYAVTDHPLEDHSTGLVAGQTVRFLEEHRDDPFALWVSFPDPHTPYEAPRRYAEMFTPDKVELPPWRRGEFDAAPERNQVLHRMLGMEEDPIEEVRAVVGVYHAMVRFVDDGVGQILDALDRLDLRRSTIVVFCSDHGDFAGEHAMMAKGGVFYDCLTRVPLVLSWPGNVFAGRTDDSMVNLIDIAPTLLELQGLDVPPSMQGQPLPTVTNAEPREATFSEYGAGGPRFTMEDLENLPVPYGRRALMDSLEWREAEGRRKMVRTRQWKYVHDPMGDKDELYDLINDTWELENAMDRPANEGATQDLRHKLLDWSILTEDSKPTPLPDSATLLAHRARRR